MRIFHPVALSLVILALLVVPGPALADRPDTVWTRIYGGPGDDVAEEIIETSDGGLAIVGATYSYGAGEYDIYLLKLDANGDTVWTRTYGGAEGERGHGVRQTSDGGYIIAGKTLSYDHGNADVYLVRTDAAGDTLWTRLYAWPGADVARSLDETTDGGFIVAGFTSSFGAGNDDVLLMRLDAAGDTLWVRAYGTGQRERAYSVQQTADMGFVTVGPQQNPIAGLYDIYLVRTDAAGDTLWTRTYGYPMNLDDPWSIRQTTDGGFIVTGLNKGFYDFLSAVYLFKFDAAGDSLWIRFYEAGDCAEGFSVKQISDGGYVFTGYTGLCEFDVYNLFTVKTDAAGDTLWTFVYDGGDDECGRSVIQTSSNDYVIAANTRLYGGSDILIMKLACDMAAINGSVTQDDPAPVVRSRPNPAFADVSIEYHLAARQEVSVGIYDTTGRRVSQLVSGVQPAGEQHVIWGGVDTQGLRVPSGIYFCRLRIGDHTAVHKIVLLR